jgi:hypothetical protein
MSKSKRGDARPSRRSPSERAYGVRITACMCNYGCGGVVVSMHDKQDREISYIKLHYGEDVTEVSQMLVDAANDAREREQRAPGASVSIN